MKERPILFSGPMVRAILEGRKTQTRRVVKPSWIAAAQSAGESDGPETVNKYWVDICPYGAAGDMLWVKETWGLCSPHDPTYWRAGSIRGIPESELREQFLVEHRQNWITHPDSAYWRPSIHMPRWASRITLEITGVRVERLQDMHESDAESEGVEIRNGWCLGAVHPIKSHQKIFATQIQAFQSIWQSINGRGSWDANPWVWVIEFRRVEK